MSRSLCAFVVHMIFFLFEFKFKDFLFFIFFFKSLFFLLFFEILTFLSNFFINVNRIIFPKFKVLSFIENTKRNNSKKKTFEFLFQCLSKISMYIFLCLICSKIDDFEFVKNKLNRLQ